MQIYMMIFHNIHVVLSNAAHEYKLVYLPRTYVEAFLNIWPDNHVGGCILEELLVAVADGKLDGGRWQG